MLFRKTSVVVVFLLTLSTPNTLAFSDTQSHWAKNCVQQLGDRKLITGYPDASFRPEATVTRAEAAVLMLNAFPNSPVKRTATTFKDVPSNYWANKAISNAYQKGFFSGYPGGIFQPNQPIPRAQIIGVVAGGKNYSSVSNPIHILQQYFNDAGQIPNYAQNAIASATINSIVVNYPNVRQLKPLQSATRGEVAALICRGLNIYTVPPQYIAGIDVHPQEVRPLPGKLDIIPTFNSNSPELVTTEGILLSTFPPDGKQVQEAHLQQFSGK
jgi:hypothetical protein